MASVCVHIAPKGHRALECTRFTPFVTLHPKEATGMLWLLETRQRDVLLSCIKGFSCISGILQGPAKGMQDIDTLRLI